MVTYTPGCTRVTLLFKEGDSRVLSAGIIAMFFLLVWLSKAVRLKPGNRQPGYDWQKPHTTPCSSANVQLGVFYGEVKPVLYTK